MRFHVQFLSIFASTMATCLYYKHAADLFADLLASKPHMLVRLSRSAVSRKTAKFSILIAVFAGPSAGVGIAERGLRSLFKEYVQGDEEEMRRPRSRGGTGLGLSICSKQVRALLSWLLCCDSC